MRSVGYTSMPGIIQFTSSDTAQRYAVFAALVAELGVPPKGVTAGSLTIRVGRYSFAELRSWADQLQDMSRGDVLSLGVAPELNAIRVRVESSAGVERMRSFVAAAGIPANAVDIATGTRARPTTNYLDTQLAYHIGGQAIEVVGTYGSNYFYGAYCSMGFTANLPTDSARYFITNSHCTNNLGIMDGSVNAITFVNSDTIADEAIDPPPVSCVYNTGGCRYSETALARFRPAYSPLRGEVFMTTFTGSGRTSVDTGSKEIAYDPMYVGGDVTPWGSMVGAYVDHLGWKTGWTTGPILEICAYTNYPSSTSSPGLLCQNKMGTYDDFGDSGGPVFQRTGQYDLYGRVWISAAGIVWGRGSDTNGFFTWYSPIDGVRTDLGNLDLTYVGP